MVERFDSLKREREKERERERIWQCKKVVAIPIIIGALGTIGKAFRTWTKKIQMENYCGFMQKPCLLGTFKIIAKVLGTEGCVLQVAI